MLQRIHRQKVVRRRFNNGDHQENADVARRQVDHKANLEETQWHRKH